MKQNTKWNENNNPQNNAITWNTENQNNTKNNMNQTPDTEIVKVNNVNGIDINEKTSTIDIKTKNALLKKFNLK